MLAQNSKIRRAIDASYAINWFRCLEYEVGRSKQCLHDHLGVYPTIFSPHGRGSKNATVINTIAKYYDLSI